MSLFAELFGEKQEGYTVTMSMQDVVKWCFTYCAAPSFIVDGCDVRQTVYSDYQKPLQNIVVLFLRTVPPIDRSHQ